MRASLQGSRSATCGAVVLRRPASSSRALQLRVGWSLTAPAPLGARSWGRYPRRRITPTPRVEQLGAPAA
eukprot:3369175-Alexandrium_andersonii.AAC.1